MRTYHYNGEYWYIRNWGIFKRIRSWFIWIGGWEKANGAGWKIKGDPTPVSILGHRVTYYGWGVDFRTRRGWWIWNWKDSRCYWSVDGTPNGSTVWIIGKPEEMESK